MPDVIYRGPADRFEIDDKVLDRDGDPVELSDEQLARAQAKPTSQFEVAQRTRTAPVAPPASTPSAPTGGSN